jgi:hypothetical protein
MDDEYLKQRDTVLFTEFVTTSDMSNHNISNDER